jgi:hypothetical protein
MPPPPDAGEAEGDDAAGGTSSIRSSEGAKRLVSTDIRITWE